MAYNREKRWVWVLVALVGVLAVCPAAEAAFPGQNGRIAFSSNRDGDYDIYTMNADGSGVAQITNDPQADSHPAWSPDGKRIAFVRQGAVWSMNADGSAQTALTPLFWNVTSGVWSPDASQIAFTVDDHCGNNLSGLNKMDADGSNRVNLACPTTFDTGAAWSPSGDQIAFSANSPGVVYTVAPDGTGLISLASGQGSNWSPDGARITYQRVGFGQPGGVAVMNSDGTGQALIAAGGQEPGWSPDGTRIAFGTGDIKTMDPDGSNQVNITNNPADDRQPDWQPALGYPRPKGATPLYASLVIAYGECTAPNEVHGPPLDSGSCAPPVQTSGQLTVGNPPDTSAAANGFVKASVVPGNAATPADEADVALTVQLTDVRLAADLSDYSGDVAVEFPLRITDRDNTGGFLPGTVTDTALQVPAGCGATADPVVGSTCALSTGLDAIVPGVVKEGMRSIWGTGQVRVWDAGVDGDVSTTGDNTVFQVQGVFVP